jgi:peptide deformylase
VILKLVKYPDPRLKQVSRRINEINSEIRQLASDMQETMIASGGVGLAGIQVGADLNIIAVINNDMDNLIDSSQYPVLIALNPEIIEKSEDLVKMSEGCLSFPNVIKRIKRPSLVTVKYTDLKGKIKTVKVSGKASRIFQHEINHILGITLEDFNDGK